MRRPRWTWVAVTGYWPTDLAARVPRVVAIDVDRPVLERAKQRFPDASVIWRNADVLEAGEELGSFDAVVSNATLHHFPDSRAGLRRMRERVRPGGTLAIVSFARPGWRYLPWAMATWVIRGVAVRIRGNWLHSAPIVWPPRDTVAELRRHVRAELPGAKLSLLPMWRVFIRWYAPEG